MEGSSCVEGKSTPSERECRICLHDLHDPVCTLCGHLFCWPCLYQWVRDHPKPCPVCNSHFLGHNMNVIPIYSGTEVVTPGASPLEVEGVRIPARPQPLLLQQPSLSTPVHTRRNNLNGVTGGSTTTRPDMTLGRSGAARGGAGATSTSFLSQHFSPASQTAYQAVRGVSEGRETGLQGIINRVVRELSELRRERHSRGRQLWTVRRFP